MKKLILFIGFLLIHIQVALCALSVQEAGFKVVLPTKKLMSMAIADFGKPKYGGSLTGTIVYPSEEPGYLEDHIKCLPQDCQYGCVPFNKSSPPFVLNKDPGTFIIMLLDRGPSKKGMHPCYFVSKVYNAQMAGADAVLVVNDEPGNVSTAVAPDTDETASMLAELTVSAAMISKEDGDFVKGLLRTGPVVAQLNWTSVFPRSDRVDWELWYNPNSECPDVSCALQKQFLQDMRPTAQSWELLNLTQFAPHYLVWACPAVFANTTECTTQCLMAGRYCVPDPDNDLMIGYSGRDVLSMNMRHLCFHRLAAAAGEGWRWWDYINAFAAQCPMANGSFTEACATEVFSSLNGAALGAGRGLEEWKRCWDFDEKAALAAFEAGVPNATVIPLLEEELSAQEAAKVVSVPTVRVNGEVFRGTLLASEVTRALCAALPLGVAELPAVCNSAAVSEDECAEGGVGWAACRASEAAASNQNRCVNTFAGYSCECRAGWVTVSDSITGAQSCQDINECTATNIPLVDPHCSCDRCACINTIGGYKCTGPLPDQCTEQQGFGGCWAQVIDGHQYHACLDDLRDYRRAAERGRLQPGQNWTLCACPPCFKSSADGRACVPSCDLDTCDHVTGQCSSNGGGNDSKNEVSAWGLLAAVYFAGAVTGGVVYALKRIMAQRATAGTIREIMSQYMPLDQGGGAGAGAAGGLSSRGGGFGGGSNDLDFDLDLGIDLDLAQRAERGAVQKGAWGRGLNDPAAGGFGVQVTASSIPSSGAGQLSRTVAERPFAPASANLLDTAAFVSRVATAAAASAVVADKAVEEPPPALFAATLAIPESSVVESPPSFGSANSDPLLGLDFRYTAAETAAVQSPTLEEASPADDML